MAKAKTANICESCGAVALGGDARYCGSCGKAMSSTEPAQAVVAMREEPEMIGREIGGRYKILAKLGEGGMGSVFRAEQISLRRKAALKVLKPELSGSPKLVQRFNAEAKLAAKLNHPNTVTLYDFGQDDDGCLFIAMEFVEGESLRNLINKGPIDIDTTLHIAEQVCASLADAHDNGIVHRDLKPDNIMLSKRGKKDHVVRVLDFGIAKLRDDENAMTAMPMTQAGDVLGTPQYMAPEQIRGEEVDGRVDVYAMGALLYEMVTARLPLTGKSVLEVMSKHLTEMPVEPKSRRPDLDIPAELNLVIMQCLQKPREGRIQSMEGVREAIEKIANARRHQGQAPPPMAQPTPPPMAQPTPPPMAQPTPPPMAQPTPPPMGGYYPPPQPQAFYGGARPATEVPSPSSSRGKLMALIALPLLAAAAAAVFFATRSDDKDKSNSTNDIEMPSVLGDSTAGKIDSVRNPEKADASREALLHKLQEQANLLRSGSSDAEATVEDIEDLIEDLEEMGVSETDIQQRLGLGWQDAVNRALSQDVDDPTAPPSSDFNTGSL